MNLETTRQMIGAEVLKLRRNRGLMGLALVLSAVMTVIVFGYLAIAHASNPSQHEVAGGTDGLRRALRLLGLFFGMLSATVIGAEAGTSDLSSGVFRDLVATGRSRLALFAVRLPGAMLVSWAFVAVAYVLGVLATFVFAGNLSTPAVSSVITGALWLLAINTVSVALAVGIGSLSGSRALTLTAIIGWQAIATPLLANVKTLGSVRDVLVPAAANQVMPLRLGEFSGITMATGTAVLVLSCWALLPTLVGGWRTRTRDA
jgi:hypothetical protein